MIRSLRRGFELMTVNVSPITGRCKRLPVAFEDGTSYQWGRLDSARCKRLPVAFEDGTWARSHGGDYGSRAAKGCPSPSKTGRDGTLSAEERRVIAAELREDVELCCSMLAALEEAEECR